MFVVNSLYLQLKVRDVRQRVAKMEAMPLTVAQKSSMAGRLAGSLIHQEDIHNKPNVYVTDHSSSISVVEMRAAPHFLVNAGIGERLCQKKKCGCVCGCKRGEVLFLKVV